MRWKEHATYGRINRGVHRKAANRIGAPALVWQLGIWRTDAVPPDALPAEIDVDRLNETIRNYINGLKGHLSEPSSVISYDDDGFLYSNIIGHEGSDRGNIATFIFRWHRINTTIRIESHTEYVSIRTSLDLSLIPLKIGLPALDDVRDELFINLKQDIDALNRNLSRSDTECDYATINKNLYKTLWDRFESEIFRGNLNPDALGGVFADFRGVVTSEPFPDENYKGDPEGLKERFVAPARNLFNPPFCKTADVRPTVHRDGFPPKNKATGESWSRDILRKVWRFVECDKGFSDVEFTANEFLEGRAVYVSSIGPVLDHSADDHEPTQFFLHFYTDDRWQIGRLVDRLTQAGICRLSAIIELDALYHAGPLLNKLERRIHDTRQLIHTALGSVSRGEELDDVLQNRISESFNEVQEGYTDIDRGIMAGSIEYRLDRSVYYMQQFDLAVKALRIERIEGYHPYDEYVERRFGSSFEFMRIMRRRILELKEDMTSLYQYLVSESLANITVSIRKRDSGIEEIQAFGEFIVLIILAPYYLSQDMGHYFGAPEQAKWWHLGICLGALAAAVRFGQANLKLWLHGWRPHWGGVKSLFALGIVVILILVSVHAARTYLEDAKVVPAGEVPAGDAKAIAGLRHR